MRCCRPMRGAKPIITASATMSPEVGLRSCASLFVDDQGLQDGLRLMQRPGGEHEALWDRDRLGVPWTGARSKSWIMAPSISPACCRTALPAASIDSEEIGLRFCGIVLPAPRPVTKGS